ncbi:hypothetical protein [Enterococcus faecalis]|uniref:hypothetical protein n=1 Tax=Enterococcus faecalis TaxID=1351 RepID=UPI00338FFB64
MNIKRKDYEAYRKVKSRIYCLRRIAVLMAIFGLGLLFGGDTPSILWLIYEVAFILWFVFYDFTLEDKRRLENKKRVVPVAPRTTHQ